jgi:hypothetical protein
MDDRKISLTNHQINYNNSNHFVNLQAEATFGDNWGSYYGCREGKVSINPEIDVDGLRTIVLPKENVDLLTFFTHFWNFQDKLSYELRRVGGSQSSFRVESLEFNTFDHPDKNRMTIKLAGSYLNSKYRAEISHYNPDGGQIEQNISITKF